MPVERGTAIAIGSWALALGRPSQQFHGDAVGCLVDPPAVVRGHKYLPCPSVAAGIPVDSFCWNVMAELVFGIASIPGVIDVCIK